MTFKDTGNGKTNFYRPIEGIHVPHDLYEDVFLFFFESLESDPYYNGETEKRDISIESDWKANLWFTTKNPLLGNIIPIDMIKVGREHMVRLFIKTSLAKNKLE